MNKEIPTCNDLIALIGEHKYNIWQTLCNCIEEKYDMERIWNSGGKKWTFEYKYRRGGKTLCCLYAKEISAGLMIIFGKDERAKVENIRNELSESVCKAYDEAKTYHDGKWVMFMLDDKSEFDDYLKLLAIKRKPNIK